ncbi:hypothetical protein [Rhodococcus sp. NBC_00294]|uniref:hypothetical protein n=1 Tax=Rhodococcus sp. NBC_00294 TaxID=2976004 RepID=UPI002E2D01E5|nr:hypothetical protein [Rhodococcus sp. NBC_00294]
MVEHGDAQMSGTSGSARSVTVDVRIVPEAPDWDRTSGVRLEVETARLEHLKCSWGQVSIGDVVARFLSPALQAAIDAISLGCHADLGVLPGALSADRVLDTRCATVSMVIPVLMWDAGATTVMIIGDEDSSDVPLDTGAVHTFVERELQTREGSAQAQFQRVGRVPRPTVPSVISAAS